MDSAKLLYKVCFTSAVEGKRCRLFRRQTTAVYAVCDPQYAAAPSLSTACRDCARIRLLAWICCRIARHLVSAPRTGPHPLRGDDREGGGAARPVERRLADGAPQWHQPDVPVLGEKPHGRCGLTAQHRVACRCGANAGRQREQTALLPVTYWWPCCRGLPRMMGAMRA